MLSKKEIKEIREHLESAQNPIFFYDNDADGLCSFLLLRRWLGRGYGVAVRSYPDLDKNYAQRAEQLGADYVFVLDKPVLSQGFVDAILGWGLPLVWIDHHKDQSKDIVKDKKMFFEYNSLKKRGKVGEPVSYLAHKIANVKDDEWLAVVGCVADHYLPVGWGKEFVKGAKEPFDVLYNNEIGEIAQAFNFGLKDSISNVVEMQKFLVKVKSVGQISDLIKNEEGFGGRYVGLKKKYDVILKKAMEEVCEWGVFFVHSSDMGMGAELSNELSHLYKGKYIVVGYINGGIVNLSMRGDNVRGVLEKVLKKVGGRGGGHRNAVGGRISVDDLDKFKEEFIKLVKKKQGK